MRSRCAVLGICAFLLVSNTAAPQEDSVSLASGERSTTRAWIVPAGIAATAAFDPELREWALRGHSRSLDHLSKSVNTLGTARMLVPAIALTYVTARLARDEPLSRSTLNAAAAYVAADIVESVLKPVVGRERPHVEGNSRRFHPFTARGDWHSMPSAHVTHIASIAEAIAMQTDSRPVSVLSGAFVAAVSWDRLYEDQHWASDVAVTVALSTTVARATVKWIQSHRR